MLIALAGVSLASVLGLALWALRENSCKGPPPELYNTDARTTPDGFDGLPRDYTGLPRNVPKLGPPLPGDLGRPILSAQGYYPQSAVDPEEQRAGQEREAARTAKIFAPTSVRERPSTATGAPQSLKDGANAQGSSTLAEQAPIDPARFKICRIASLPSSTRPSIAAPSVPIA